MTVLSEPGKPRYDTLADLVRAHPEIDEACLVCTVNGRHRAEDDDGAVLFYAGTEMDREYSFIGRRWTVEDEPRDALLGWAEEYGVWDDQEVWIEGSALVGRISTWVFDRDADRGYPDGEDLCSMSLVSVRLPSGWEVRL